MNSYVIDRLTSLTHNPTVDTSTVVRAGILLGHITPHGEDHMIPSVVLSENNGIEFVWRGFGGYMSITVNPENMIATVLIPKTKTGFEGIVDSGSVPVLRDSLVWFTEQSRQLVG